MKKILLGAALLGTVCAATAQTDTVVVTTTQADIMVPTRVKVYRLGTTTSNEAYVAPDYIVYNFNNTYPAAATTVVWEPMNGMWRATYMENNRVSHMYYNTNGVNYKLSLPVINTYVPEEVVTSAIEMYGTALYSISALKPIGDFNLYQVRLLDNTYNLYAIKDTWMDSNGVVLTDDQVVKIKQDNDKLKIKSDEGKEKIKMDE
jgi:hypothetical protein